MSTLQKDVLQILFALPDNSLLSLKPLLGELLTGAVLAKDPTANVLDMDEYDKILFLKSLNEIENADYVSFEDALIECGVSFDEIYDSY